MTEHALPWARARTRRRRPFGPTEWCALAFCCTGAFVIATCVVCLAVRDLPNRDWPIVATEGGLATPLGMLYVWLGWAILRDWWESG